MHVTRLAVEGLVLQTRGLGRHLGSEAVPGEGPDGAPARPGLQHRLVLRT